MCHTKRNRKAFTLVEMMVAVGLGSLLFLAVAAFSLYVSRSYVPMTNYADMDEQGQLALDRFTQQVRQVKSLTSYTSSTNGSITSLTFKDYDDQTLTFTYDPNAKSFSRIKGGTTNLYLSAC